MIPNATALLALTSKPKIDEINLRLLQEFYAQYLNPKTYTYTLADENVIILKFEEDKFCHLVGVEQSVRGSVSPNVLNSYKGKNGWNRIKNEEITFAHLKATGGKAKFGDIKIKLVYFYLLPHILSSPNKVVYYNVVVNHINCEILIYDIQQNAYIHLGIEKGSDGIYFPRTFLIEKITASSSGTKFIVPQPEPVNVIKTVIS
ncbi:PBECR4 domain-containing protein [Saccharibacillus sp. JS10]|uniref:PBECR4 domain-containing protein n=1 Tax=Saccharibacillus sp. JS10 TaxID=2950552 RepID=UPI00210ABC14|nr:PBECR4 domain-containing protein [Saccharibacillus sp. JS10]MCQ4086386.1 PBECR4 domain-containing protein [Saccharibacillus sp. JS10]